MPLQELLAVRRLADVLSEEPAGEQLYRRRLERAAAVPVAEAPPEVGCHFSAAMA